MDYSRQEKNPHGEELLERARGELTGRMSVKPRAALILGSGLSPVAEALRDAVTVPYSEIPGMAGGTVAGHRHQLVAGVLETVPVLCFAGRLHYYEGHDIHQVTYPVRLAAALGARTLVVTNASGSLREEIVPGSFVILRDHLHLMGANPLRGDPVSGRTHHFVPLAGAYDASLRRLATEEAAGRGLNVREGVYVGVAGPSYETAAEVRAYAALGGDIIGMSTTPEVIEARGLELRVLALSAVTNSAGQRAADGHAEVLRTAQSMTEDFVAWLRGIVARLEV